MLSVHQVEAILAGRLDAGFGAPPSPPPHELAHWEFAHDRMVLAVPRGHPLTKRSRVHLKDLRDLPFIWFPRWVNPAFYDHLMQACWRGGLKTPRVVQEAPDRDTQLGLVQCEAGVAWLNESTRWHCPRGVALVPVADMKLRLPFSFMWRAGSPSSLLAKFLEQVKRS